MIGVVIITHGQFGQELLRTSEEIIGRQDSVMAISLTHQTGRDHVSQSLDQAIAQWGSGGLLILVDMLGGTPCNTSLLKAKTIEAEIVTGVNLYMLLSAFRHRGELDLKALAAKSAEDGKRAIVLAKDLLAKRVG